MKVLFLISALILAPLSFASYHGSENNVSNNNSSSSYGGSSGLAIVGVLALAGGLAYYFTRDPKGSEETENELLSKVSAKSKRFELGFSNYQFSENFDRFDSNGLRFPENNLQLNFKYNLN